MLPLITAAFYVTNLFHLAVNQPSERKTHSSLTTSTTTVNDIQSTRSSFLSFHLFLHFLFPSPLSIHARQSRLETPFTFLSLLSNTPFPFDPNPTQWRSRIRSRRSSRRMISPNLPRPKPQPRPRLHRPLHRQRQSLNQRPIPSRRQLQRPHRSRCPRRLIVTPPRATESRPQRHLRMKLSLSSLAPVPTANQCKSGSSGSKMTEHPTRPSRWVDPCSHYRVTECRGFG